MRAIRTFKPAIELHQTSIYQVLIPTPGTACWLSTAHTRLFSSDRVYALTNRVPRPQRSPPASSHKALHMSYKRTRAQYEADLQKSQSPYVAYGTPLPPLDPDVRDDGSYVPVWKQEVRDEKGRKRLHGAFTGGWSAG